MSFSTFIFRNAFLDGYAPEGSNTLVQKSVPSLVQVSLSWLLNNARHCAQNRDYSVEHLQTLLTYVLNANARLQSLELSSKRVDIYVSPSERIEDQCGARLARIALEITDERALAVSPSQYVSYTLWTWLQKPIPNGFAARLLEDLMRHNFIL